MPRVTVVLPSTLTAPEPARTFESEAATVGDAVLQVAVTIPRFAGRILSGRQLLVHVLLNGSSLPAPEAMTTKLEAGDRLDLVSPIAGG